jgi:hypothetical protein
MHRSVAKYFAFGEVNVNPDALDKNQICLIKFLHEKNRSCPPEQAFR